MHEQMLWFFITWRKSADNFAITKSIYKDKNNSKFKNNLVKAFRNMHLQYWRSEDAYCEKLLLNWWRKYHFWLLENNDF